MVTRDTRTRGMFTICSCNVPHLQQVWVSCILTFVSLTPHLARPVYVTIRRQSAVPCVTCRTVATVTAFHCALLCWLLSWVQNTSYSSFDCQSPIGRVRTGMLHVSDCLSLFFVFHSCWNSLRFAPSNASTVFDWLWRMVRVSHVRHCFVVCLFVHLLRVATMSGYLSDSI